MTQLKKIVFVNICLWLILITAISQTSAWGFDPVIMSVSGNVKDTQNNPIEGATVQLKFLYTGRIVKTVTTNDDGDYSGLTHTAFQVEEYEIIVSYSGKETKFVGRDSGTWTLNFVLFKSVGSVQRRAFIFYDTYLCSTANAECVRSDCLSTGGFDTAVKYNVDDIDDGNEILDIIRAVSDSNDWIFLYICAHGTYNGDDSFIEVDDGGDTFGSYVMGLALTTYGDFYIECGDFLGFFDACHAGGFHDVLENVNKAGVATSTELESIMFSFPGIGPAGLFGGVFGEWSMYALYAFFTGVFEDSTPNWCDSAHYAEVDTGDGEHSDSYPSEADEWFDF